MDMEKFIKNMPKVELHAHLNGSLSTKTLLELATLEYGETNNEFQTICRNFQQNQEFSLDECFKKFPIAHALTTTKDGLRRALLSVIRDFSQDNVVYLELRTTPKSTTKMSKVEYLETVLETIRLADSLYPDICVKLLPSIDRSKGIEMAKETMSIVTEAMKTQSDLIKGIDLSGNPAISSFDEYGKILSDAKNNNLKLALHCAEIDNSDETYKMLQFGMDRCGHGTFITSQNLNIAKEKQIPIECCLTSNLKCGTVKSYVEHHFKNLYQSNHPVVLCTDDPGVFDTTLSDEFIIAQKTFNLSTKDLELLSLKAVDVSFADSVEKEFIKQKISKYFND
ncbi:adenosine deaminase-like protein [Episyrphus balteatus]|uniref:adenosine deaminase-like protein n=1 Tax=Episyrphus balteatus TaxID=286459 RepID=UPI002486373E|nr:adenosine deaminase-like protein [Episyrphus balteatus]